MATAYSTILKLALPVQGELSGTWGDVVNNNITSMVEEAIAGRKVIDSWTANSHTLTSADGTTAESRAAMLEFTDTGTALTGAATVICPTNSKLFVCKNDAGQQVTIKTSGGTGVAIPDGETMFVFCDGTNVEQVITNFNTLKYNGYTLNFGGAVTTADAFTTSGAYPLTLTATASTNVTLPTTGTLATLAGTETLTNKSIDVDNNTVTNIEVDNFKTGVVDTDLSSVSASDDTLASAKAIKTYVDAQVTAADLDFAGDSGTGAVDLDSQTFTVAGGTGLTSTALGQTVTIDIDSTVATLTGSQTLTNKTLTTPVISSISNTGTLTLPTSTDTVVGRATTDTLTNKSIDLTDNTVTGTLAEFNSAVSDATLASLTGTETLTNKTVDADNNTISNLEVDNLKSGVLDTDLTTVAATDTTIPSAKAVKTYVDAQVTASDLDFAGDSGNGAVDLDSQTFTVAGGTGLTSTASGQTVTVDIDSTVATLTGTQTLTNKTIDSASNTLTLDLSEGTLTGTTAEFNTALSDGSFATLAGTETLTNKSIDASQLTGTVANARLDAQLQDIAGLTPSDGNIIVGDGANFVAESGGIARASLGLGTISTQDSGSVSISGGNIDGTAIGATVRSTAQFTTLQVQSTSTLEGTLNLNDDLDMGDNNKIRLGTSDDLEMYHDGANSRINDAGTGSLKLQSGNNDRIVIDSNVTIQGLVYPSSDGTNGQVLTTDGAGSVSFQDAASGGVSAGFAIAMAIAL